MCLALGRLASGVSHVFASWCGVLLWEPNFSVIMCIALGCLASKCFTCVCQLALVFFGRQNFSF